MGGPGTDGTGASGILGRSDELAATSSRARSAPPASPSTSSGWRWPASTCCRRWSARPRRRRRRALAGPFVGGVLAFVARRLAPEFSGGTVSFGDAEFYNGTVYTATSTAPSGRQL